MNQLYYCAANIMHLHIPSCLQISPLQIFTNPEQHSQSLKSSTLMDLYSGS